MAGAASTIELSVIAPAHNEEDNVSLLVREANDSVDALGIDYEILIVDDGSTDRTLDMLRNCLESCSRLRVIRMARTPPGRGNGQSAAFHAGVRASRGRLIALLDADLQNDPADIPRMLVRMRETGADLVQGNRSAARRDSFVRRVSSRVGFLFRRLLLGDRVRDTGCSLRVMTREVALSLPLEYRGMHRFIPVTAASLGFAVVEMPVNHRPRTAGAPKYGVWNRAFVGIPDCLAVRWMRKRRRPVEYTEVRSPEPANVSAHRDPAESARGKF